MVSTDQGAGKRGKLCPDLSKDLRGVGPGSFAVWVIDVGDDTTHWEVFVNTPPQDGPHVDSMATAEGCLWYMSVYPAGVVDGGGRFIGGGYLRLFLP